MKPTIIIGPQKKKHQWRKDHRCFPVTISVGTKKITGDILFGKTGVNVFLGEFYSECPSCVKEFSRPLFKAVSRLKGKKKIKKDDFWVTFHVAKIPENAQPIHTRTDRWSEECVAIEYTYWGTCPIHGKVKVVDHDVADYLTKLKMLLKQRRGGSR
jgi:hypothetical protein